jgi:uncharacterized damage-inducible protein DinB
MTIAQMLVPEFDHEMATTRTLLERVPGGVADWKPHPKSMSMGHLASHIASMPQWTPAIVREKEVDFSTPAAARFATPAFESTAKLVEMFDRNINEARMVMLGASDADLGVPWALRNGAHQIFSLPRAAVLRSFIMSHIIHHRGQLSVYLRLRDVPLPSIYGPTADS